MAVSKATLSGANLPRKRNREDAAFVDGAAAAQFQVPPRMAHLLLIVILLFFVVMGIWAHYATLDEVTRGEGRVIPSRQIQVIQNLEGGIVRDLLVREGEIVEEDQILLQLDNIVAASDYRERRARYFALLASQARLRAEIEETAVNFPPQVLVENEDLAESELALFYARQEELDNELELLRRQTEQRQQELLELKQRQGQVERSLALAQEQLDLNENANRRVGGTVPKSDLLNLRREVNDLTGELEQTRISIPRAESALREAHQRIETTYSNFRSESLRELQLVKAELASVREVITAGEDTVNRTDVRSPVRGTVKQLHMTTIGGVIRPGEEIVEIVPLEDTLLIEAQVRPADIAFLRPGLEATVKVTAYDYSIYGGLKGTVEQISADTIVNEQNNESFYKVRVRTEDNHLGTEEEPLEIIPGMTAQVDVLTGEKSVLDYLLKPILKARDNALRER